MCSLGCLGTTSVDQNWTQTQKSPYLLSTDCLTLKTAFKVLQRLVHIAALDVTSKQESDALDLGVGCCASLFCELGITSQHFLMWRFFCFFLFHIPNLDFHYLKKLHINFALWLCACAFNTFITIFCSSVRKARLNLSRTCLSHRTHLLTCAFCLRQSHKDYCLGTHHMRI